MCLCVWEGEHKPLKTVKENKNHSICFRLSYQTYQEVREKVFDGFRRGGTVPVTSSHSQSAKKGRTSELIENH